MAVFDWDRHNLKKIGAHRLKGAEAEEALSREPILIYEQDADGEARHVYYGETARSRLLAIVPGKSGITWSAWREENDAMNKPKERITKMPRFLNEDEEAKWWASAEGREFLKLIFYTLRFKVAVTS
jgi:uncharacterized DUF497 family protein